MGQWRDVNYVLGDSNHWLNQIRRNEHDWKIYSLEQQIRKTEVIILISQVVKKFCKAHCT